MGLRGEDAREEGEGPFCFDLCHRNSYLANEGVKLPKFKKTGTTIAGVLFKDGVVLGADTRATNGDIVATKNAEKIHYIAPNIYCCGAGTAADTFTVTNMISSQLELHRYATNRKSRVVTALTFLKRHLFQYQGNIESALVLGGVDCDGPHLHTIYPNGSTDNLPFATMGSGSMAAMAVFEGGFKEDMTREEAMKLVADSIKAGIFNDLASGSNVDLTIITKDKTEVIRSYEKPNPRTFRNQAYLFPPGTAKVLTSSVEVLKSRLIVAEGGESMVE